MGLTLKNSGEKTGRNEPCPCKSGLKFKYCHGDPLKKAVCNRVVNEKMAWLIQQEKIKKGLTCKHGINIGEHCKDCVVGD